MRYHMMYLKTQNVNLVKDMGMIPYKLHKLFGYDSTVVTYNYGDFPYLQNEVAGLKLDFAERKYNNYSLDGVRYLRKNAKEIDILQIFHVTLSSVAYAFTYKRLNPDGKIFLKLDCSHKLVDRIKDLGRIQYNLLNKFLDKVDLMSVEQEILYPKLKKLLPKHSHKLINIPNGVDFDFIEREGLYYDYGSKENIILNAARIGAEEKNTEMLLEAFAKIDGIDKSGWKLVLAGPIEEGFEDYIDIFFKKNPGLKDSVIFKGNIQDRKELFEEYKRAKIFCLTSEFESFAIALIEAAAMGDVIVSTDVGIARELVTKGNSKLVSVGDVEGLRKVLTEYIYKKDLEEESEKTYQICRQKFDWNRIIKTLNEALKNLS